MLYIAILVIIKNKIYMNLFEICIYENTISLLQYSRNKWLQVLIYMYSD